MPIHTLDSFFVIPEMTLPHTFTFTFLFYSILFGLFCLYLKADYETPSFLMLRTTKPSHVHQNQSPSQLLWYSCYVLGF